MMKRAVFLLLAVGLLSAASGCGVLHTLVYAPFGGPDGGACGPCGVVADGPCDGPACEGPVCGGPAYAGPACGAPCGPGVGPHRAAGCGPVARPHPLRWVASLFSWGCTRGCGETYWGDWSDPPDCHDPCDRGGNYLGSTCYGGRCGSGPGGPAAYSDGAVVSQGYPSNGSPRIISQTDRVVTPGNMTPTGPQPTPIPQNVQMKNSGAPAYLPADASAQMSRRPQYRQQ